MCQKKIFSKGWHNLSRQVTVGGAGRFRRGDTDGDNDNDTDGDTDTDTDTVVNGDVATASDSENNDDVGYTGWREVMDHIRESHTDPGMRLSYQWWVLYNPGDEYNNDVTGNDSDALSAEYGFPPPRE